MDGWIFNLSHSNGSHAGRWTCETLNDGSHVSHVSGRPTVRRPTLQAVVLGRCFRSFRIYNSLFFTGRCLIQRRVPGVLPIEENTTVHGNPYNVFKALEENHKRKHVHPPCVVIIKWWSLQRTSDFRRFYLWQCSSIS